MLLTFVGTTTLPHGDDADADQALVIHDHTAHHERLRLPAAAGAPTHCALCHWLQSLRVGAVRQARGPVSAVATRVFLARRSADLRTVELLNLPSRAPPV